MITASQYLSRREIDVLSTEDDDLPAPECEVAEALAFAYSGPDAPAPPAVLADPCDFDLDEILVYQSPPASPGSAWKWRLFQVCARHTAWLDELSQRPLSVGSSRATRSAVPAALLAGTAPA
jgi:hypothetical protein